MDELDEDESAFKTDIARDLSYFISLARAEYSTDITVGDRPLRTLDELFSKMAQRIQAPDELAYVCHLFGTYFGDFLIKHVGGRWGMTQRSGLQVEYIGNRRSVKVVEICAARMLADGVPLPLESEFRTSFLAYAAANPDEVMSFETMHDILKAEQDENANPYLTNDSQN